MTWMIRITTVLAACVYSGCCQSSTPLKVIAIAGRSDSGCSAQMRFVGSSENWTEFWKRCDLHPDEPPAVRKYGIVGVCLGARASGGSSITARAWIDHAGFPVVAVRQRKPEGGPLTVTETPCEVFEVPEGLSSADWTKMRFVDEPKEKE